MAPQALLPPTSSRSTSIFSGPRAAPIAPWKKNFWRNWQSRDQQIKIITFELTESRDNRELFKKVGEALQADVSGVPFTVVGEQYVIGWLDEASTGAAY